MEVEKKGRKNRAIREREIKWRMDRDFFGRERGEEI